MGVDWADWRVAGLLAGFALAQFSLYTLMPVVVRVTSATSVNLSLLTSDFFSLIAGILLFQFKVPRGASLRCWWWDALSVTQTFARFCT